MKNKYIFLIIIYNILNNKKNKLNLNSLKK